MQGRRGSDSDNAAAVAAIDDSMNAEDGDPSSDENSSAMIEVWSDASTGVDEWGFEEYGHPVMRAMIESWMRDAIEEGENGSDTTRASGGDGDRGDVAPPGVGHSSCAKGVGKDKGKVHDGCWIPDLSSSSHIMQPLDTNSHQELRQQWETMVGNVTSPEALQRRRQKTIEAWTKKFGKRSRLDTGDSERQSRIRTTNKPAAVAAE